MREAQKGAPFPDRGILQGRRVALKRASLVKNNATEYKMYIVFSPHVHPCPSGARTLKRLSRMSAWVSGKHVFLGWGEI